MIKNTCRMITIEPEGDTRQRGVTCLEPTVDFKDIKLVHHLGHAQRNFQKHLKIKEVCISDPGYQVASLAHC